jgi:hypothetical protein
MNPSESQSHLVSNLHDQCRLHLAYHSHDPWKELSLTCPKENMSSAWRPLRLRNDATVSFALSRGFLRFDAT